MKRVRHHGFAQLLLMILLFVIAVFVFGGWSEGPFLSGLWLGLRAYGLLTTAQSGDIDSAAAMSQDLVTMVIVFIINLIIFYAISAIIIFVYNLFFGRD